MKKIIRGLLYEKGNDEISLGRVVLWTLLIISIHFWYTRPWNEFPSSLSEAFMYTLAYNLFKKSIQVARDYSDTYFSSRSSSKANLDEYEVRRP